MTMLNCPFCGSKAKHHYTKGTTSWGTVSCSNKDCPCRSHFHPHQWNERCAGVDMQKKLEWHGANDLPPSQAKVLVKAVNPTYQFGYAQLLAGWFIKEYYDTPINEFRLTGVEGNWTVVEWAYAPE